MMDDLFSNDDHPNTVVHVSFPSKHNWRNSLRYFEKAVLKCVACNESGHISSQCFKSLKKCIYCTSSDHLYYKCPERICIVCRQPGHLSCNLKLSMTCMQCNAIGHKSENCISRSEPIRKKQIHSLKCINCKDVGHANCFFSCDKQCFANLTNRNCFICGHKGHSADICPEISGNWKLELFRTHVKEAMVEMPEMQDQMNCKERRYWEKVEKKAFKNLLKKQKIKKKKQKNKQINKAQSKNI